MLREETTRSKRTARQPNGRDRDGLGPHFLSLETQKSVPIAATAVVGLIAKSMAATGMGDGSIAGLRAGHLDQ